MFELSDFYTYCKQHDIDIIAFNGSPRPGATIRDNDWYAIFLDFTQIRSMRLLKGICYHEFKKKIIYVQGARVRGENGLVNKKQNKNDTSRRTIPIIPPLYEALQNVKQRGEYVTTMTGDLTLNRVNKICRENGLPEVGLHGLRHSFASLAYHLGIPEKIAMQIGGWKDAATMHKIYVHLAQRDIAKCAQDFSDYFDADKRKEKNDNENGNAE